MAGEGALADWALGPRVDSLPISFSNPHVFVTERGTYLVPLGCLPGCYLWAPSVLPSQDVQGGRSLLRIQIYFLSKVSTIIPMDSLCLDGKILTLS